MASEWLTYAEAGKRLGVSPEAVRQKAIRNHWPKRMGNDKRAVVQVDIDEILTAFPPRPDHVEQASDTRRTEDQPPVEQESDIYAMDALKDHIQTLKEMALKAEQTLAFERGRVTAEQQRADAERERADIERARADDLLAKLESANKAKVEMGERFEKDLAELRGLIDGMKQPLPWWKRLVG